MIPDYQTLMRPILESSANGEVRISDVIDKLADDFALTEDERTQLLPSGKQTTFANRAHWARTYLKQADLISATKRAHFVITDRGRAALAQSSKRIDNEYLQQFEEFRSFKLRSGPRNIENDNLGMTVERPIVTPDEEIRYAFLRAQEELAAEILQNVINSTPLFFEHLIIGLLVAMGYGGGASEAGRAVGQSGDNGIDGVIDQDTLGVDQIFIQAKRYSRENLIGPGAIRDFYGALNLKRATKGVFVTTSSFTSNATETAANLSHRIVLIDGTRLSELMVKYNIGCRVEDTLEIKKIDEEFFP